MGGGWSILTPKYVWVWGFGFGGLGSRVLGFGFSVFLHRTFLTRSPPDRRIFC